MQKTLLHFIFVGLLLSFSCSEKDEVYSIKDSEAIENQLNKNWDLYSNYLSYNLDSALFYSRKVHEAAHKTGKVEWVASAHEAIGHIQYQLGFLGDAAINYFEAAKIFKETGNISNLANVYNSLGAVYAVAEENETAISYYLKAKDIFFYEGPQRKYSLVSLNIAICYMKLNRFTEAQEMLALAGKAALDASELSLVSKIHNNQGVVYSKLGFLNQARESYLLSLANTDSLSDHSRIKATAYNNIGETYLDEGKLPEAEKYLHQALSLKKEIGDPYFMQSTLNYLAEIEIRKGRHEEAVALLEGGLNEADLHVIEEEVGKGLALLIESVSKASETPDRAKRNLHIEKLATYSKKLVQYNNNLLAVKQQIENTSKRQSLQLAEEKFSMGEELKEAQEKNAGIKFAFIIPILFLICAVITTFYTFQKNKRMEKVLGSIDMVIKRKPQR